LGTRELNKSPSSSSFHLLCLPFPPCLLFVSSPPFSLHHPSPNDTSVSQIKVGQKKAEIEKKEADNWKEGSKSKDNTKEEKRLADVARKQEAARLLAAEEASLKKVAKAKAPYVPQPKIVKKVEKVEKKVEKKDDKAAGEGEEGEASAAPAAVVSRLSCELAESGRLGWSFERVAWDEGASSEGRAKRA